MRKAVLLLGVLVLMAGCGDDSPDYPLASDYFDRATTLDIHANLFGEIEGMNEAGGAIPYVESISISVFNLDGAWEPVDEGDDFFDSHPGAYHARYNALLHFNNPNYHRWEVDQMLDLVAISVTVEGVDGWQLLAIRGYEGYGMVATENISYDRILAMYRF